MYTKRLSKRTVIVSSFIVLIFISILFIYTRSIHTQSPVNITVSDDLQLLSKPTISLIPIKNSFAKTPQILARTIALYDVDSGTFLYGVHEGDIVPIASITKIMTSIVALEQYKITDVVTVSKESTHSLGSVINLREGEMITVESLLYGLLIPSGNDAAHALAKHSATLAPYINSERDPVEIFVTIMNEKAKEIGLTHTVYKDPAGLDDTGISTARDQGLLIAYALRNETFRKIINTPETTLYSTDMKISHVIDNSNRLVKEEMYYQGIIGGKTGFTPAAGHNLVTAATRDGHTLVAVIFNTFDSVNKAASAIEARKLLDWGFANFTWLKL